MSDETGRFEVVTDLPDLKTKWQVSTGGGQEPVWSKSGRELFFREGNRMMSVVFGPSTAQPSRPVTLFEGTYAVCCPGLAQYDVMPDGRRFLMIKDSDEESFTELRVVKNWGGRPQGAIANARAGNPSPGTRPGDDDERAVAGT